MWTICSHLLQNISLCFPVSFHVWVKIATARTADSNGSGRPMGSPRVGPEEEEAPHPEGRTQDSYWLHSSLLSTVSQIKANGKECPTWNSDMGKLSWSPIHLFSLYTWRWNGVMKTCHLVSGVMDMWVVEKKKGKVDCPWVSSASWIWQNGQPDRAPASTVRVRSKRSKPDVLVKLLWLCHLIAVQP